MSSPLVVAQKLNRLAVEIKGLDTRAVNKAALTIKTAVQAQLAVATPSGRLNVGKRGSRVGVRYTLYPHSARVYMFGPAQLLERDTKPHRIPREFRGRASRSGTRRRNTKVIDMPGIGVRAYAMHPGTRGKHPWAKGLAVAEPLVYRSAHAALRDSLVKSFR